MSIVLAIGLAASTTTELPKAALYPVGDYLQCTSPGDPYPLPNDHAGRERMTDEILGKCLSVRRSVAAQIDRIALKRLGRSGEANRKAEIEGLLSSIDRQVRFQIVHREEAIKQDSKSFDPRLNSKGL